MIILLKSKDVNFLYTRHIEIEKVDFPCYQFPRPKYLFWIVLLIIITQLLLFSQHHKCFIRLDGKECRLKYFD